MIVFPSCCDGCLPPKRNATCHCTCKEYKDAKEEHEAKLVEERRKRRADSDSFVIAKNAKRTHEPLNRKWWK